MKSMKSKKIKPVKDMDKNVKDAVSEYLKYKDIKDKSKAKFIKLSDEEYRFEIEGKVRERLNIQQNLNEAYVNRLLMESRLKDMESRITQCIDEKLNHVDWLGFKYSLDHIQAEFNKELFDLKKIIRSEIYLKDQLIRLGFTVRDFNNIVNGVYIQDVKQLELMEQQYESGQKQKKEK